MSSPRPPSLGLRNWRGEIVEPLASAPWPSDAKPATQTDDGAPHDDEKSERKHKKKKKKTKKEKRVLYVKDEFGRDVAVVDSDDDDDDKKSKKKKKSKRSTKRSGSASPPSRGRLRGTPPPEDPFRPQLDEHRYQTRAHRRRHSRSRSRERRRSSRRSASRSRSRSQRGSSRHQRQSRSRSRSRSRTRRRRSSSKDRWAHDAFTTRSPSPMREIDPGYHPEPENWVSRAGGVYLPRK
ncbi:hypothetical protein Poli38472_003272 [Pythium oligandrum]|uniref:Uncharacterized protein n=1 Tax=Pythium oligandrum TaxID=41045 RepID=A0A8K1FF63_PYTOL|nr:hypothetical protein Poli38472_003272 [Pythium oligandrum]|eukprot:TMW57347.1 hypothetical protein Poli38472_003272 [Pythium oligandrum]